MPELVSSSLTDRKRPPSVLVVEDEAVVRLATCDYLQHCGFRVYAADNAEEAIKLLKRGPAIDIVFTDVMMPGDMDGFGLARWIRENRPNIQVVLTSGGEKKAAAARRLCENEPFFAKPYNIESVVNQFRKMIQVRSA